MTSLPARLLVLDLETTGLSVTEDEVIQLGFAVIDAGRPGLRGYWTFQPAREVHPRAAEVNGFTRAALAASPTFAEYAGHVRRLVSDRVVLGHNARRFDVPLLARQLAEAGLPWSPPEVVDTYELAAALGVPRGERSLAALCLRFGIAFDPERAHDALYDVRITWAVYCALTAGGEAHAAPSDG